MMISFIVFVFSTRYVSPMSLISCGFNEAGPFRSLVFSITEYYRLSDGRLRLNGLADHQCKGRSLNA